MPRSGVLAGHLYSLDMPATDEIKIFRGSDLRLEGKDLVVESLSVTLAGLEDERQRPGDRREYPSRGVGLRRRQHAAYEFRESERKPLPAGGIVSRCSSASTDCFCCRAAVPSHRARHRGQAPESEMRSRCCVSGRLLCPGCDRRRCHLPALGIGGPVPDLVGDGESRSWPRNEEPSRGRVPWSVGLLRVRVLVTALHVVRDREVNATGSAWGSTCFAANRFPLCCRRPMSDEVFDLAVLFVDHASCAACPDLPARIIGEAVSPSSLDELAGARSSLSEPLAARGRRTFRRHHSRSETDARHRIERTAPVLQGVACSIHSGRLVGMVSSIDSNTGELVVFRCRDQATPLAWSIEYGLGTAAAPTGGAGSRSSWFAR